MATARSGLRTNGARAVLSATTAVLVLLPTLRTGWFGDDASYANLPAAVATGRLSRMSAAWASYSSWLGNAGRWYPGLVLEKYAVFSIFENRLAYKIFLIAISLVALAVAGRFLARLWGESFAFLSISWTIACFQIRGYHDPFLAYNGMIQVVTICLFSSLSCFLRCIEAGAAKRRWLVASLCLYVLACTIYEISYVCAPLYVLVAWSRRPLLRSLVLSLPFAAIGLAFVIAAAALRLHAHIAASHPYAARLDVVAYAAALWDQLSAALPLSYLILDPSKIFLPPWQGFAVHFEVAAFVVAALCAYATVPRQVTSLEPGAQRVIVFFGACLVVLPAIEIPALLKYQTELKPGLGYLPVFLEYFGIGILIAAFLTQRRFAAAWRWTIVVAFAGVVTLSTGANEKVADILDVPYLTSRVGFENALSHGLLAAVPAGATLAIVPPFPWVCDDGACIDGLDTSDVVAQRSQKSVKITALDDAEYVAARDPRSGKWSLSRR